MKDRALRIRPFPRRKARARIVPPADKSITHRAILLACLSAQASRIRNPLLSGDCLSTLKCFRDLGVPVSLRAGEVSVPAARADERGFRPLSRSARSLDCGNSGTTMRLLSGVLAAQDFTSHLVGDASLSRRPMRRVMDPLRRMGARIGATRRDCAPIVIRGQARLKPVFWKTEVASAQVKSAILLAGLFADGKTAVQEPTRSRDHTERMLRSLGARVRFDALGTPHAVNRVSVWGGGGLRGVRLTVPGDFSSAAFFLVLGLILPGAEFTICGVNLNPTRIGLLNVLKRMGADLSARNLSRAANEPVGDLTARASRLRAASVGREQIPLMIDEVPILAVAATQARGRTVISGAQELRAKESDRLAVTAAELKKMGAAIEERRDGLVIDGPTPLRGAKVDSHFDHRIAMSLAVAAQVAGGDTVLAHPGCVRISFPGFFQELERIRSGRGRA